MKRCPECRRDYYDDSLLYCLDDGSPLLEGPASMDEPGTAILPRAAVPGFQGISPEAVTRPQITGTDAKARLIGGWSKIIVAVGLTVLVGVAGFFGYRYFASASSKQIDSIAVMPFVNESRDRKLDFLSDGMTETLIGRLSEVPTLSVKARSSVFRYKDKDVPVGTIGRELNVPAVITGNLMRHENAFVLHVELVDCASETVIWHGDYDRPNSAFATVAGEIARDVANRLRTRLSGPDERRIAQNYTENSAAYELYLKGRFYWDKRDPESFATAENAYKQAITLDPNYALAYAGLADLYLFRGTDNERQITMPQARAFALKALALDESLAEAHTTLAFVNENFDFDMRAAERGFKRAIELKPNYAIAHQFFGGFLVQTGHVDEGLAEVRRAVELEPYSAAINWHLGLMLMFAGHYDEAIEQQQKTLLIQPNYDLSEITLAAANIYAGRLNEASAIIQKRLQTDNTNENWLTIARIEILSGNRGKGIDILDRVLKEQAGDKTNNYSIAGVYATLGESDKAIDWLNRGYEQRAFSMFFLRVDPLFDSLHNDQRYQDLLRRLNLSE